MSKIDLFNSFRPIRNKLSELSIFDNLYVVSEYIKTFDKGGDLESITSIENPQAFPVMPDFADFLIANSVIYSSDLQCSKNLKFYKDREHLIKLINALSNIVTQENIDKDVWLWWRIFSENQNDQKLTNMFSQIYRHYRIYDDVDIERHIASILNMSYKDYLVCSVWIYSVFSKVDGFCTPKSYFLNLPSIYEDTSLNKRNIERVLNIMSCPLNELKGKFKENISYEYESIFKIVFPDYIKYPIIDYKAFLFCPIPQYILKQCTEGLYHIVDIPKSGISHLIGKGFERFIGEILAFNNNDLKFTILPEIIYKKGTNKNCKSSDWILYDDEIIMFIECKTKRLKSNSRIQLAIEDDLEQDLNAIANGVSQIYSSFNDYKNGLLLDFPYDSNKRFIPILITSGEYFLNVPSIKDEIVSIVKSNLVKKELDENLVDLSMYQIYSSQYFEKEIQLMSKLGLSKYFELSALGKIDNELRSKYVTDLYYADSFVEEFINPIQDIVSDKNVR